MVSSGKFNVTEVSIFVQSLTQWGCGAWLQLLHHVRPETAGTQLIFSFD